MKLAELQRQVADWVAHNFPSDGHDSYQSLLGVTEEVGELAHAHLKGEQCIRGTAAEHEAAARDAVGDVTIYLIQYCIRRGWSFAECVEQVWAEVQQRDWRRYPDTGRPGGAVGPSAAVAS